MDGVLVDSEPHFAREQPEIYRGLGVAWSAADNRATLGLNQAAVYRHLVEAHGVGLSLEEFLARVGRAVQERVYAKVRLVPGARELLAGCSKRGISTALASSSPGSWIDIVLERFSLRGAFDAIVNGTDFRGRGKPAPDIFLDAAKRIGVAPADCMVIEDSHNGVLAAKAAGMRCICLANLKYSYGIASPEADLVVQELSQIDLAALAQ